MNKILIVIVAFSMILSACKTKSESKNEDSQKKSTEIKVNRDALVLLDVSIKGMSCTGCENIIKSCISGLPGVVEVSASFVDGKARVKLDTTLTKIDKITEAVDSKGYAVTGYKPAEKVPSEK
jgi:copper chaperone CopZ